MKLRTFDDFMGMISIPLSIFGMYICYLSYAASETTRLAFFAVMTILTLIRAVSFLKRINE